MIAEIPPEVWRIYVIDDACPDHSGAFVETNVSRPDVRVIVHEHNQGVGGAVMTGYRAAIADGADVIVKVDGDGQMDPKLIPHFVDPILSGEADYTKGNRFYDLEKIRTMPLSRLFGNAVLSLMTKLSSGYWNLFDPTNGYTAIHADVAKNLPFDKISRSFFFETDMLFRLNTFRALVIDVPMDAKYADEATNLEVRRVIGEFLFKHARNFCQESLLQLLPARRFARVNPTARWHWQCSCSVSASADTSGSPRRVSGYRHRPERSCLRRCRY